MKVRLVNIENRTRFSNLYGGIDHIIANETHLTKDLTGIEGRDDNTCIVEDIDAARDNDIKSAAGVAFTYNNITNFILVESEIADNCIKIFLVDILEEGEAAQQVHNWAKFIGQGVLIKSCQVVFPAML